MEKVLKLYSYNGDGVENTPFPSSDSQIEIYDFTYDAQRMGDAPTITASVKWGTCLDNVWQDNVFAEFNGEKYFLKQTPTSSYSNEDARYKHDLELVSERIILNDVFFYDVVATDIETDKPLSNSSKVTFSGNISEFVQRLNYSLQYANLQTITDGVVSGYNVVVDDAESLSTESKFMSFENQFFSNVLQEMYNVYEIPYYFVGKTIHVGFGTNQISEVFEYGINNALLSITKENANNKIVNRCTGVGSSENIPYYYPNLTEDGTFTLEAGASNKGIHTGDIFITSKTKYAQHLSIEDELMYVSTPLDGCGILKYKFGGVDYTNYLPSGIVVTNIPTKTSEINVLIPVSLTYNGVHRFELGIKFNNSNQYNFITNYTDHIALLDSDMEFVCNLTKTNVDGQGKTLCESQRVDEGNYNISFTLNIGYQNTQLNETRIQLFYAWANVNKKWQRTRKVDDKTEYQLFDTKEIGLRFTSTPIIGDTISIVDNGRIIPQTTLMPSIYRNTMGAERFYNAENNTHPTGEKDENGNDIYYEFENTYNGNNPKEHIVTFEDIKPTIVGIENNARYRIDMFTEFAYDENDSDETVEIDGNLQYKHPFFFGKLRKFDGEHGFNLFDQAIETEEMKISFTDGSCGGCEFVIAVSEDEQKNTVQVDSNGNLVRDENGDVLCGKEYFQVSQTPQDRQNDTLNNEVWVALRKDDSTFGTLMPAGNLKPKACTKNDDGSYENDGDSFVITNIDLPLGYVTAAEERLEKEIINYMATNNSEKFTFSIKFSRIYLEENQTILNQLSENSTLVIRYNGINHSLYVSSFSYKMTSNEALPEITVELTDTITIIENAVQNAINAVKYDILSRVGNIDWLKVGLKYFLRKDINDATPHELGVGKLKVDKVIQSANFMAGLLGNGFQLGYNKYDENGNGINTHLVVDTAEIRKRITFNSLEIKHVDHVGGEIVLSPAGGTIERVEQGLLYSETYPFDGIIEERGLTINSSTTTHTIEGVYWLSKYNCFAAKNKNVYYKIFASDGITSYLYNNSGGGAIPNVNFIFDGKSYSASGVNLVENKSTFYRCYFKKTDGEDSIVNDFEVGDLVKCQTFNLVATKQRYYWREVIRTGADYIDLSALLCDPSIENDIPMSGDIVVTMGNRINTDRRNVIVISSYESYAPSITMYQDVRNYNLDESNVPVRISPTLGNKFTGDFYIQILADDGTQQVMALAEFLENRISLSVTGLEKSLSDLDTKIDSKVIELNNTIGDESAELRNYIDSEIKNCIIGENAVQEVPFNYAGAIGFVGMNLFGKNYVVKEDVARTWNVGDKVVFYFLFKPDTEDVSDLWIGGNGVLNYMFDDLDLSSVLGTGTETRVVSGVLTCNKTLDEAIAEAEANEEEIEFGVLISARGVHQQGALLLGYPAALRRTGIDIENGRITLDAQTTTIKDGNKEIAVFTTNADGKAVLSTELIEAERLKVNQLETAGVKNADKQVTQTITINQNKIEVKDEENKIKVKIHGGKLGSESISDVLRGYKSLSGYLLATENTKSVSLINGNILPVNSDKMAFDFKPIVGQFDIKLNKEPLNQDEFAGINTYRITASLYRGNKLTDSISNMEIFHEFGEIEGFFEDNIDQVTIPFNFDGYNGTLPIGYYRLMVTFSTASRHLDSTSYFINGDATGITGTQITDLQEIATDGYHFGYGNADVPAYQQANEEKFEVVYGDYGLQISASGIKIKKTGTDWTSL